MRRLRAGGATVLEAPAIVIRPPRSRRPLDRAIARLEEYRFVVFTSVNGVAAFFDRLRARRRPVSVLSGARIFAIGPATAAALRRKGVRVAAVPEEYRAEGVARLLAGRQVRGARILIPRAAQARDLLVRALARRGARVDVVAVYRTVPSRQGMAQVRAALRKGRLDLVTFASSSTVDHFVRKFRSPADRRRLRQIPAAVIGPITAATARRHGFRVVVQPRAYTIPALAAAIAAHLRTRTGARRRVVD